MVPYQTSPELGVFINKWGCNFMSICYLAAVFIKKSIPVAEVLRVYQVSMKLGYLQKEVIGPTGQPEDGCEVHNYIEIFRLFGGKCKAFKSEGMSYVPREGELEILRCRRAGHAGYHFMAGNGVPDQTRWQNEIAFDPIESHFDGTNTIHGSWTQFDGEIVDKRIIIT